MSKRLQWVVGVAVKKWRIAAGMIAAAFVLVLALVVVKGVIPGVTQPVVTCSAAQVSSFRPPATLVTAQDYFAQGDYDFERGDCDRAIADYSRAIELKPDFAEAYNNRAYTFMVKQDYADALLDLDHAIQLRPDYVNALMNRGDIYNYYYAINYDRAIADYDRVLQLGAEHTSVCGHRLLASHHGWNLSVFGELFTRGTESGCAPSPAQ